MYRIFPSFFICPICGKEFVSRFLEPTLGCPKCDFKGSKEHFILTKTQDIKTPHHPLNPLKMRREKRISWRGLDWFFLGFPPRNGRRISV
jgi:ssDNA-binding Zn-finger/Zn-ribbon topoisomerase 1